jgi:hypothetical protein
MIFSMSWGAPCLVVCHIEHGQWHGFVLSRRLAL